MVQIIELSFPDKITDIFAVIHFVDDHHCLFFVAFLYKSVSNWHYELVRYLLVLLYLQMQSLERFGEMRIILLKLVVEGDANSPIFLPIFFHNFNLVIPDSSYISLVTIFFVLVLIHLSSYKILINFYIIHIILIIVVRDTGELSGRSHRRGRGVGIREVVGEVGGSICRLGLRDWPGRIN